MPNYPLAECTISAIFNSGAGLFQHTPQELNKMTQPDRRMITTEINIDRLTVEAAFWPDENGGPIHSVLVVASGAARIQVSATEADIRQLASMLTYHANTLKEATTAREALGTC